MVIIMLDEYIKRSDVISFMQEIKTNERYYQKEKENFLNYDIYFSKELALYLFYDALLKFKIILDDIYLFDEYIEQLEKLYRKLDNFSDISIGINKLICRMVGIRFQMKDMNSPIAKKEIIEFIYKQYIVNGYFVHGFNISYLDEIQEKGFVPEEYENYYERFKELAKLLLKNGHPNAIQKDFDLKKVSFTDDFVMGCYYSAYAPMFFSNLLSKGKRIREDAYLMDDYSLCIGNLKKTYNFPLLSEKERQFILSLVDDEWKLLHRKEKKIALLLGKRSIVNNYTPSSLDDFLQDEADVFDVVDRLLNSKHNNVSFSRNLKVEDCEIVVLDDYYEKEEEVEKVDVEEELNRYRERESNREFINKYGNASIFLVLGSFLLSLGVIITIIMLIRGL